MLIVLGFVTVIVVVAFPLEDVLDESASSSVSGSTIYFDKMNLLSSSPDVISTLYCFYL
jgi:hypothetical protein